GVVAMLARAHARHGSLPWADLFEPAIRLSEEGFEVSPRLSRIIERMPRLDVDPAMKSYLFLEDGSGLPVGHRLTNPEYAKTLRLLASDGPDVFYEGEIAEKIVDAVTNAPVAARPMTLEDLGSYKAMKRDELCGRYRQYTVCGMPPPSSGGVTVLQILGILETFDIAALEPDSPEVLHLIVEASRLAYADRNLYLGDTDFIPAPIEEMLNAEYLTSRASLIKFDTAFETVEAGDPVAFLNGEEGDPRALGLSPQPPSTSHFSVIDARGNAVSMTTTVEAPLGSHLMAGGFVLNNQLTDFSFIPEVDGKPVANAVAPGKRPRSSMSPTIVFDENGSLYALIGSPGGPAIIGYTLKALLGVMDWGLSMQEAIDLPNLTVARGRTTFEAERFDAAVLERLREMGHDVNERPLTSGLHGVVVTPDGFDGGADPRREGVVVTGRIDEE
ncbi:MAG: gamma-glutamyltransferase family protein, partial [Pseudomonadota bacterium]